MSILLPISALGADMPKNLTLDAGVMFKNVNLTHMRSGTSTAFVDAINPANTWVDALSRTAVPGIISATRNGTTFALGKSEHQVGFDSKRLNLVGLSRINDLMPSLKTGLLETAKIDTSDNTSPLGYILGSSSIADWTNYLEWTPSLVVADDDYISNVALVASVSGELEAGLNLPLVIVLEMARVSKPSDFGLKDHDELVVEVVFEGHALASNQYAVPCHIFVPVQSGS